MKHIIIYDFVRPALVVNEHQQEDGTIVSGDFYWTASAFNCDGDPKTLIGSHDILELVWSQNPKEKWLLTNARVMLSPEINGVKQQSHKYVAMFDRVMRVI